MYINRFCFDCLKFGRNCICARDVTTTTEKPCCSNNVYSFGGYGVGVGCDKKDPKCNGVCCEEKEESSFSQDAVSAFVNYIGKFIDEYFQGFRER